MKNKKSPIYNGSTLYLFDIDDFEYPSYLLAITQNRQTRYEQYKHVTFNQLKNDEIKLAKPIMTDVMLIANAICLWLWW